MSRTIESGEYQAPKWEEFSWIVDGANVSGYLTVVEEGESVRRIRLAIEVPLDAQIISFGSVSRTPIERSLETGQKKRESITEEMIEVSWYSEGLKIGMQTTIPRELVQRRDDKPLFIQVVDVSLF